MKSRAWRFWHSNLPCKRRTARRFAGGRFRLRRDILSCGPQKRTIQRRIEPAIRASRQRLMHLRFSATGKRDRRHRSRLALQRWPEHPPGSRSYPPQWRSARLPKGAHTTRRLGIAMIAPAGSSGNRGYRAGAPRCRDDGPGPIWRGSGHCRPAQSASRAPWSPSF